MIFGKQNNRMTRSDLSDALEADNNYASFVFISNFIVLSTVQRILASFASNHFEHNILGDDAYLFSERLIDQNEF